jgi:hypothetical protein
MHAEHGTLLFGDANLGTTEELEEGCGSRETSPESSALSNGAAG